MNSIIIILIAYLLLFNAVTTYRLLKSDLYDPTQKVFQSMVIWLLPLVGAAIISQFLNDEPMVLSEKASKYMLLIKFMLLPFNIRVKTKIDNDIGNYAKDPNKLLDTAEFNSRGGGLGGSD